MPQKARTYKSRIIMNLRRVRHKSRVESGRVRNETRQRINAADDVTVMRLSPGAATHLLPRPRREGRARVPVVGAGMLLIAPQKLPLKRGTLAPDTRSPWRGGGQALRDWPPAPPRPSGTSQRAGREPLPRALWKRAKSAAETPVDLS